jgi:predicted MFS family arabinose efflux permease
VLGTAFPHLLKDITSEIPWKSVVISTSVMTIFGGSLLLFFVPDGPFRKPGQNLDFSAFAKIFSNRKLRSAAFGYFGHMWELYAFWTFVPVMLSQYKIYHSISHLNLSFWSFVIIGIGFLSCVLGGLYSQKVGAKKVAMLSLSASGICCLLFPIVFVYSAPVVFILFLLFWGMVVISDSPMFSTLVAQNATPEIKGTALTLVNCIGFAITIISIQLLSSFLQQTDAVYPYLVLVLGPIFGLMSVRKS